MVRSNDFKYHVERLPLLFSAFVRSRRDSVASTVDLPNSRPAGKSEIGHLVRSKGVMINHGDSSAALAIAKEYCPIHASSCTVLSKSWILFTLQSIPSGAKGNHPLTIISHQKHLSQDTILMTLLILSHIENVREAPQPK
jgi:hypothetical protein